MARAEYQPDLRAKYPELLAALEAIKWPETWDREIAIGGFLDLAWTVETFTETTGPAQIRKQLRAVEKHCAALAGALAGMSPAARWRLDSVRAWSWTGEGATMREFIRELDSLAKDAHEAAEGTGHLPDKPRDLALWRVSEGVLSVCKRAMPPPAEPDSEAWPPVSETSPAVLAALAILEQLRHNIHPLTLIQHFNSITKKS